MCLTLAIPLSDAKPGSICRITSIFCDKPCRRYLLEMGIVTDTEIEVVREAPLMDPVNYKIGDFYCSLRKSDTSKILVELISTPVKT